MLVSRCKCEIYSPEHLMNLRVAPDLFQFAVDLRQVVEKENPIKQGIMFALGRSNGLRIKTLAGMAKCSESHVHRMLLLLKLPNIYVIAVAEGAPYTPILQRLGSGRHLPDVQLPESFLLPTGRQAGSLGCSGFLIRPIQS